MLTIYKHDSPVELVSRGENEKLRNLLSKVYWGKEVEKRIASAKKEGGKVDLYLSKSGRDSIKVKVTD